MSTPGRRTVWLGTTAAWLLISGFGLSHLLRYSATPGAQSDPPGTRPELAGWSPPAGVHTLVLAIHPHCPCSRATLGELDAIMARCRGHLAARVLFVRPAGFDESWVRTDLWRHACRIPGASVAIDDRGREALSLGARTSGQVVLYDPAGRLVYRGGITGARGHQGSNAGRTAVIAAIEGGPNALDHAPVYGCPLERPGGEPSEGATCPRI
jgi:hypothetical protein